MAEATSGVRRGASLLMSPLVGTSSCPCKSRRAEANEIPGNRQDQKGPARLLGMWKSNGCLRPSFQGLASEGRGQNPTPPESQGHHPRPQRSTERSGWEVASRCLIVGSRGSVRRSGPTSSKIHCVPSSLITTPLALSHRSRVQGTLNLIQGNHFSGRGQRKKTDNRCGNQGHVHHSDTCPN